MAKKDRFVPSDALELLQKCVALRYQDHQQRGAGGGGSGVGAGKGGGKALPEPPPAGDQTAMMATDEEGESSSSGGGGSGEFVSGLYEIRHGLIDMLLRSPKGRTRRACFSLLCDALKGQERADFLNALLEALPAAESEACATTCQQYFELLLALLQSECLEEDGSLSPSAMRGGGGGGGGAGSSSRQDEHDQRMGELLRHSIGWMLAVEPNSVSVPQDLLAGHLGLARVLLQLPSFDDDMKTQVGVAWGPAAANAASAPSSAGSPGSLGAGELQELQGQRGLVHQLLDVFLFPAYRLLIASARAAAASAASATRSSDGPGDEAADVNSLLPNGKKRKLAGGFGGGAEGGEAMAVDDGKKGSSEAVCSPGREHQVEPEPACRSTASREAAEQLLLSLCTGSPQNFTLTSRMLQTIHGCTTGANGSSNSFGSMISADTGRRADVGFVGLKNLGMRIRIRRILLLSVLHMNHILE
jgi:hypothetical protein